MSHHPPNDDSSLQLSNSELQTLLESAELPFIWLTGSGGLRSIFTLFDVACDESPTMLLTLTVT